MHAIIKDLRQIANKLIYMTVHIPKFDEGIIERVLIQKPILKVHHLSINMFGSIPIANCDKCGYRRGAHTIQVL